LRIPTGLISGTESEIKDKAKHFCWDDNETIAIMNDQKVAKLVKVFDNFKEFGSAINPYSQNKKITYRHYFMH